MIFLHLLEVSII